MAAQEDAAQSVQFRFMALGAGQHVGRSCFILVIEDVVLMLDCGVHMGEVGPERLPDWPRIGAFLHPEASPPLNAAQSVACIDAVLISHCHLDHVAALPTLRGELGYNGPVLMTPPTAALAPHLVQDYQ